MDKLLIFIIGTALMTALRSEGKEEKTDSPLKVIANISPRNRARVDDVRAGHASKPLLGSINNNSQKKSIESHSY